jgi:hypothetical protein
MNVAVRLGVAALLVGVWSVPSRALAAEPRRAAVPAWVEPRSPDYAAVKAGEQGHDSFTLLWDSRVRVEGDRYHRYERRVRRALTATGVERLAELMVGFDPEQEQLVLHRIELRRGSESFDQTKSARVRLVADESDLERRQYNGDVTAFIVLSDVRAGDAIDFSYSIIGSSPVLAGRYVGYFPLVGSEPTRQRRIEWSSLRFQDATLHAARLQCSGCGDAQRRYFSIASPESDET